MKFGSAVTVRVSVVLAVVEPLVPVMVNVAEPTVAVLVAVNVSVVPAEPVTVDGLNAAVTPAGSPLMLRLMVPLKPLIDDTVTLSVAEVPCSTVAPVVEIENPGAVVAGIAGKAFWTSVENSVVQNVPAGGELGIAPVGILLASALLWAGSQFGSLNVVVGEGSAILELLSGEDKTLLIRRDALLVLDLGLDIVDGVRRFHLKGDSLSGKGLNKDLHNLYRGQTQISDH